MATDAADTVEGIANMGVAMKYAQPTQVVLTSAKETSSKMEAQGSAAAAAKVRACMRPACANAWWCMHAAAPCMRWCMGVHDGGAWWCMVVHVHDGAW